MASMIMMHVLDIRAVLSCVVKSDKVAFYTYIELGGGGGGGSSLGLLRGEIATRTTFSLTPSLFFTFVKVSCLKNFQLCVSF